jgi:nucleoside-diphosphate-sugar epimerase
MYCVLGANGFIGRNLVRDLGAHGVGREELDLTDARAVDDFFNSNSFDVVIHCAVVGGSRITTDEWSVFATNIKMFENVGRHAHKFKRFIWFSSGADTDKPYGYSKYICEKLAKLIPNCQVFRIYGCYGEDEPSTRFISTCLRGPVHIPENKFFDFFWVRDIHKVIQNLTVCDGKVRDLVYKKKYTLFEIAKLNKTRVISLSRTGPPYIGKFDEEIGNAIGIFDRKPVMRAEKECVAHDSI